MDDPRDTPAHPESGPRRFSSSRSNRVQRVKPISHECLRQHDFFKNRDPKLLDVLLDAISVAVFLPGVDIVTEGEEGSCMYFLNHGDVEVLVGTDRKQVATLKDGSIFGEMALLGYGKRIATVHAASICDCRVINAHAFHLALKRFPAEREFFHQLAKQRREEVKQKIGSVGIPKLRCVSQGVRAIVRTAKGRLSEPSYRRTMCSDQICTQDEVPSPPAKGRISEPSSYTTISSDHLCTQDEVPSPPANGSISEPSSRTTICSDHFCTQNELPSPPAEGRISETHSRTTISSDHPCTQDEMPSPPAEGRISETSSHTSVCSDHFRTQDEVPLPLAEGRINWPSSRTTISSCHLCTQDEVPSPHSPQSPSSYSSAVDQRSSSQLILKTALDNICFRKPALEREPGFEVNYLQNHIAPPNAPLYGARHCRKGRRISDLPTIGSKYASSRSCSLEGSSQQDTCGRRFSGGVYDVPIHGKKLSGSSYARKLSRHETRHGRRWSETRSDVCRLAAMGAAHQKVQVMAEKLAMVGGR